MENQYGLQPNQGATGNALEGGKKQVSDFFLGFLLFLAGWSIRFFVAVFFVGIALAVGMMLAGGRDSHTSNLTVNTALAIVYLAAVSVFGVLALAVAKILDGRYRSSNPSKVPILAAVFLVSADILMYVVFYDSKSSGLGPNDLGTFISILVFYFVLRKVFSGSRSDSMKN